MGSDDADDAALGDPVAPIALDDAPERVVRPKTISVALLDQPTFRDHSPVALIPLDDADIAVISEAVTVVASPVASAVLLVGAALGAPRLTMLVVLDSVVVVSRTK